MPHARGRQNSPAPSAMVSSDPELSHPFPSFFVNTTRQYADQRCPPSIDTGEVCTMPTTGKDVLNIIREQLDLGDYRKVHWEGNFEEYVEIVRDHPEVTRTAYQR